MNYYSTNVILSQTSLAELIARFSRVLFS